MEGRTSFIVAHRLSTIQEADLILVMKDGNIIEQGRHRELLEKKGFYEELMEGRTSFIVAHRLSTIQEADLILVMKDGNIIEQGRHRELLEKKGFYAHLYESQFAVS